MKLDNLGTTDQLESFLNGRQAIVFAVASSKDERYHSKKILGLQKSPLSL